MPSYKEHTLLEGVVFRKSNGIYAVRSGEQMVTCELSNLLHKDLVYPIAAPSSIRPHVVAVLEIQMVDPVAIGDEVRFTPRENSSGMIVEVLPRRSRLARREATGSSQRHAREQVIVANLDQVVPVMAAADPPPRWNLLDRYLASAESLGLRSLIVITKLDLLQPEERRELEESVEEYRQIGYEVILTSADNGEGIDTLRASLNGRLTAFIGKSGVGKSSLLNAMQPGLGLRVSAVSGLTGKGRHTTTHLEMFDLESGGGVVDTPGMREFGLWQIEEGDLAFLFPEMRPWIGTCRFGLDCSHTQEPGCNIRKAVGNGAISQRRYDSMLRMREE
jgi:ribosome biogenesis GTPase / thiamine phosphate phosphatase